MPTLAARWIAIVTLAMFVAGGCATPQHDPKVPGAIQWRPDAAIDPIYLNRQPRSAAEATLNHGLQLLSEGKLAAARRQFEHALAIEPRNVGANFLNAYVHHQLGRTVDPRHLDMASVGYNLTLEFDPQAWWAAYYFGALELERENYARACTLFRRAHAIEPQAAPVLAGLMVCSYYLRDIPKANEALAQLPSQTSVRDRLHPLRAIIFAAAGRIALAEQQINLFRQYAEHSRQVQRLEARVRDWRRYDGSGTGAPDTALAGQVPSAQPDTPAATDQANPEPSSAPAPRQIVIEATILRATRSQVNSTGLNLLDGLSALFSFSDTRTIDQASGVDDSVTKTITRSISSAELEYSLNIFNRTDDRSEIVAQPTLVVMEDKPSTFFSGDLFLASITGQFDGETLTERVGVTLEVTPQFVSNDEFILAIAVGNSDFSTEAIAGTFQEALSISSSETNVNVRIRMGQTLLLAGLTEQSGRDRESRVPVLGDVPLLQNLFNRRVTQEVTNETIILLTPRKVFEFANEAGAPHHPAQSILSEAGRARQDVLRHQARPVSQSIYSNLFRRGDARMPNWRDSPELERLWDEALAAIYF